jgi:hypothetical protein
MREISPAINASAEEYYAMLLPEGQELVVKIREEKKNNSRPIPSDKLIDKSNILTSSIRCKLIDKIAMLVDESLTGRSDMCQQFSMLLSKSLTVLGVYAKTVKGKATYCNGFSWDHYWVETKDEIIDANVDMLFENPVVPPSVSISPYWGKKNNMPNDRKLKSKNTKISQDVDVKKIWWPELNIWLKNITST